MAIASPIWADIESLTLLNDDYRRVLYTDEHVQLVVMSLLPREEIGFERHRATQFIRIEQGTGVATIDGVTYPLSDGKAVVIPSNAYHNIVNSSPVQRMKLYTLYSPPQHAPNTVEHRKREE